MHVIVFDTPIRIIWGERALPFIIACVSLSKICLDTKVDFA